MQLKGKTNYKSHNVFSSFSEKDWIYTKLIFQATTAKASTTKQTNFEM